MRTLVSLLLLAVPLAAADLGGHYYWPSPESTPSTLSTTNTLNSTTLRVASIFLAPKSGTVTGVRFAMAATTTGATLDARLESLDLSTALPSGTLLGTNTNASVVVADTDDKVIKTATLTGSVAVTYGTPMSLALVHVGTGNMVLASYDPASRSLSQTYSAQYTTAWAKSSRIISAALEYSDGSVESIGLGLWCHGGTLAVTSSSTPNEVGIAFTVPSASTVAGAWLTDGSTMAGNWTWNLYDSDGITLLATVTTDKDLVVTTGGGVFNSIPFDPVVLQSGVTYRLTVAPADTSGITIVTETAANNSDLAYADGGTATVYTSRSVKAGTNTLTCTGTLCTSTAHALSCASGCDYVKFGSEIRRVASVTDTASFVLTSAFTSDPSAANWTRITTWTDTVTQRATMGLVITAAGTTVGGGSGGGSHAEFH